MTTGRPPIPLVGYGLPDNLWLSGLAGGDNNYTQDVVASTTQTTAGATPMGQPNAQGIFASLIRIATVANANDAVSLPQAVKGRYMMVLNAAASNATVFASPNVNRATGVVDTIIGAGNAAAASVTLNARVAALFFCPADGTWARL